MTVGLILPAVKYHKSRVAPVESRVRLAAHVVKKLAQPDGIPSTYLVVAPHIEHRNASGSNRPVKLAEEARGLLMAAGIVYTVAVEHHKIIGHVGHLAVKRFQCLAMLVDIVENYGGEIFRAVLRKCKRTYGRERRVAKFLMIRSVFRDSRETMR